MLLAALTLCCDVLARLDTEYCIAANVYPASSEQIKHALEIAGGAIQNVDDIRIAAMSQDRQA